MTTRNSLADLFPSPKTKALNFWNQCYVNGVRIDLVDNEFVYTASIQDPITRTDEYGLLGFPQEPVEPSGELLERMLVYNVPLRAELHHGTCPAKLRQYLNQVIHAKEYEELNIKAANEGVVIGTRIAPYGWRTYFAGKRPAEKKRKIAKGK